MDGLRIGMDGKRAVCNNVGLGNYSRLVIDVLSKKYVENRYLLYTPRAKHNDRLAPLLKRDNVEVVLPSSCFGRMLPDLWRIDGVSSQLKREKIDLFHGLSNELPLSINKSGIPSVVTIHDLIFRRFPECYKPIDRCIYDYKFRKAAINATRVIAITECTKRDIIDMYHIPEDKIDVVYQGCDTAFYRSVSDEVKREVSEIYGLPQRYIVAVGTVERRKNQLLAIKALRRLPDDVMLFIVGRRTAYADELDKYIDDYGLRHRVKFLVNVPFAHLPALYAMAVFSSYTSRFEGFGIPVMESIATGTPVVAATGSSLEEAGGPGGLYVDPDDVSGYVSAAFRFLDDTDYCRQVVEAGRDYISRFCPDNVADGTMASYRKAMESFNS